MSDANPLLGLSWEDTTMMGRSKVRVPKESLNVGMETIREILVSPNPSLPWSLKVNVDADGFELRLRDPFGTPVFEWRFEATAPFPLPIGLPQ